MDTGVLYDVVIRHDGVLAGRAFAPMTGMKALVRSEGITLWSLEPRHGARFST